MPFRRMLALGALTATSFVMGITMGRVLTSAKKQVEGQIVASELDEFLREHKADVEELERIITEASDNGDGDYDTDSTIHDYAALDDVRETTAATGEVDTTAEEDEEPLNADDPEWAASLLRMAGVFDDDNYSDGNDNDNDNDTNDQDASGEPWYNRDQDCEAINHALWESTECLSEELREMKERNEQLRNNLTDTYMEIALLEEELAVAAETSRASLESQAKMEAELEAAHKALHELRQEHFGVAQILVDCKRRNDALAANEAVVDSTQEEETDSTPQKADDDSAAEDEEDGFMSPHWWRRWFEAMRAEEEARRNCDVIDDFGDYELRRFFHRAGGERAMANDCDTMDDFGDYELKDLFLHTAREVNPNAPAMTVCSI